MLDFLVISEVREREEYSCLLIVEELKRRGYKAAYLTPERYKRLRTKKKTKVLVKNNAGDYSLLAWSLYAVVGEVRKCVSLSWEQILHNGYKTRPVNNRTCSTINEFCWGDANKHMMEEIGYESQYIHEVGPIHMDFVTTSLCDAYEPRFKLFPAYGIDSQRKTLLFVGDADLFTTMSDQQILDTAAVIGGENELLEYNCFWTKTSEIVPMWLKSFLERNEDWQIIYRGHPGVEQSPQLDSIRKGMDRFFIINDLPFQQWLLCSDAVATIRSTAVVEAFFAHIPFVVMRPFDMKWEHDQPIFDQTYKVSTYEEFETNIISGNSPTLSKISDYYDVQNTPSYVRVCDSLEKILKDDALDMIWDEEDLKGIISEYDRFRQVAHPISLIWSLKERLADFFVFLIAKLPLMSSIFTLGAIWDWCNKQENYKIYKISNRIKHILEKGVTPRVFI